MSSLLQAICPKEHINSRISAVPEPASQTAGNRILRASLVPVFLHGLGLQRLFWLAKCGPNKVSILPRQ
jgi:hypothetical protein